MGKTITQCSNNAIAVKVASSVKPMTSLIKFTDNIRSIQQPNAKLSIVTDNGKNQFKADILKWLVR
jgi:hypothetical protein